jgi:hypothetical protein
MSEKSKTSILLTPAAKQLLALLARHFGVSQSAIIELAIREKAQASGLAWRRHETVASPVPPCQEPL